MNDIVCLNGVFLPRQEARISPDDRGFHFADGVYEVIKYYRGKPFRLADHLERLSASLSAVGISYSDLDGLPALFVRLLQVNNLSEADAAVYLQISRGTHFRVHHFPEIPEPTVYAFCYPFPSFTEKLENGISTITAEDIRWLRCDIKSVALLPNSMLYQQAVVRGAGECILIRAGMVTEATHSSVFAVWDGIVITHPLSNLILPGITRKVLLEICRSEGIPVEEKAVPVADLDTVDDLMVCGTGGEVMPVITVDGKKVGTGTPGPVTRWLQKRFFDQVSDRCGVGPAELGLDFLLAPGLKLPPPRHRMES